MRLKTNALVALALSATGLAACTTAEEATQQAASRWVGQPSDAFFARYGAPRTEFYTNNGGVLYRWRGGETTITRSNNQNSYEFDDDPFGNKKKSQLSTENGFGRTTSRTTTSVQRPNANTTITRTRTTSTSANVNVGGLVNAVFSGDPKPTQRTINVFCELQIATDENGTITGLTKIQDTGGTFGLSRCDEVLNK
ncbi:MAG: hypothetical protein AAGI92_11015 [Pseudomonadota bacterium]